MSFRFLTARWTHLFLATYAVPDRLLAPRLPKGFELDRRDGQVFASLVAFHFQDTRVLGIPWPGYRHFPEINLRFYVRRGEQRGIVFIREFVSRRLVAWVAQNVYNEPFLTTPLSSAVHENEDSLEVDYRLNYANAEHRFRVKGAKPAIRPRTDSVEHFFIEHEWGFNVDRRGRPVAYRVIHPKWEIYPVKDFQVSLDWEAVYGPEWRCLQDSQPISTILAAGSKVELYSKSLIECEYLDGSARSKES